MPESENKIKVKAKLEYYPRRSVRGKLSIVRNVKRKQSMVDKLTNPYAQGIYTGAAAVGLITGMAMMARRQNAAAQVSKLKQELGAKFGYPCGNSFTSDRHKCYTDPKTGARLKKPITRSVYDRIMKSGGKAAQTLYRDREDRIRSSRRDGAKGWKKDKQLPDSKPKFDKLILDSSARKLSTIFREKGLEKGDSDLLSAEVIRMAAEKSSKNPKSPLVADDARDIKSLVLKGEQLAEELDKSDELEILLGKLQKKKANPISAPKLTLDKVETSLDREKFAAQQLADAKARGDKKDIKSWEDAAKSTRKARVNESISKSKQTQGTLFDTTVMDDSPLMKQIRSQQEKSRGNFGYYPAEFAKDKPTDDRKLNKNKQSEVSWLVPAVAAGYVGQQTVRSGLPRVLGVRLESHSTSNKNAAEILKNGGILDPNKSGSGAIRSLESMQGKPGVTDIKDAKGKVYITGVRKDSIARNIQGLGVVDPKNENIFVQLQQRKNQRLGYRGQSDIDWDKIAKSKSPLAALNNLNKARVEGLVKAAYLPWHGRSLYIGGSDDYFEKNFKPDFDDPRAQYTDQKIKVYGNRLSATKAAIEEHGLLNLMKANKGRVAAGAAILGVGGLVTAALVKTAVDRARGDGMVDSYKRRSKKGKISLVRGFKRELPSG